jgi:glycosyltransferase involved in cell wall biosynthesis
LLLFIYKEHAAFYHTRLQHFHMLQFQKILMHIVYLTHQFLPANIGGVEVYTFGLAKRAVEAGHTVTVITYRETDSLNSVDYGVQYSAYENIPVVEIVYNLSVSPNPMRYEYDNPFTANILRHVLLKLKPDLAHVMHAMKLSAGALSMLDRLHIPFIVTLCDFWFICPRHTLLKWDGSLCRGPAHRFDCVKCVQDLHGFAKQPHFLRDVWDLSRRNRFIKNALLKARHIISLSNFQKEMYSRNGIPAERIQVIQHGVEPVELPEHRERKTPYRIGFIGSLVEYKGAHILVQALKQLEGLDFECHIYGDMRASSYLEKLKALASVDGRIQFKGTFEPEAASRVIAEIDVLAVPALWYENEPLVVKLALLAGLPVLLSDIGSLSGMVEHGKTGWLVPPGNVDKWADAIRNALKQLPEFVMPKVHIKTMNENAQEILALYKETVQ